MSATRFVYVTCVKADSSFTQGPCEHTLHHSRVTISFYSTLPTGLIHCFIQSTLYINLMICLKVLETLYSGTALLYKWDILWFSRITYTILSVILNFLVNNSKTICNVIGLSGTITELGCYLMQSFSLAGGYHHCQSVVISLSSVGFKSFHMPLCLELTYSNCTFNTNV